MAGEAKSLTRRTKRRKGVLLQKRREFVVVFFFLVGCLLRRGMRSGVERAHRGEGLKSGIGMRSEGGCRRFWLCTQHRMWIVWQGLSGGRVCSERKDLCLHTCWGFVLLKLREFLIIHFPCQLHSLRTHGQCPKCFNHFFIIM